MKNVVKIMLLAVVLLLGTSIANAKTIKKAATRQNASSVVVKSTSKASMGDYWIGVQGYGVRIRATPSLRGKVVGSANWGDSFLACGYVGGGNGKYGWYKIWYRGRIRYISAQFAG